MNIAHKLPSPLNTFQVDIPKGIYYDFELPPNNNYPLPGVTYPVDYGNIPNHFAEDGHELDLFVGTSVDGVAGFIIVDRGDDIPDEHKFYVALTLQERDKILEELEPVLLKHQELVDITELLAQIAQFKHVSNK